MTNEQHLSHQATTLTSVRFPPFTLNQHIVVLSTSELAYHTPCSCLSDATACRERGGGDKIRQRVDKLKTLQIRRKIYCKQSLMSQWFSSPSYTPEYCTPTNAVNNAIPQQNTWYFFILRPIRVVQIQQHQHWLKRYHKEGREESLLVPVCEWRKRIG